MESTTYTAEQMAEARGATLFEAGQSLHAVQAIYRDDPHLDLIVSGWQTALGQASQNPTREIDKYSAFSLISEMSLFDINTQIEKTTAYVSFPVHAKVHFGPDLHLQIGVGNKDKNTKCIYRYEQFRGWLRGLCFADQRRDSKPNLTVVEATESHGWDVAEIHPPILDGGETVEIVATCTTLPEAQTFVEAHDAVWDMLTGGGWLKGTR